MSADLFGETGPIPTVYVLPGQPRDTFAFVSAKDTGKSASFRESLLRWDAGSPLGFPPLRASQSARKPEHAASTNMKVTPFPEAFKALT